MIADIACAQLQLPPTPFSRSSARKASRGSTFFSAFCSCSASAPSAGAAGCCAGAAGFSGGRAASSLARAAASSLARASALARAAAMTLACTSSSALVSAASSSCDSCRIAAASRIFLSSSGISHTDFFVTVL